MNRLILLLAMVIILTPLPGCWDPREEDHIQKESIPLPEEESIVGAPKKGRR